MPGQGGGQHRRQLAAGDDMRGLQVVRRGVEDLPRQPLFAQPLIDHAAGLPAVYPEVTQAQEGLQIQIALAQQRVLAVHRQLERLAHPVTAGETRRHLVETAQHQVQLALVQRLHRQAGAEVANIDADARCLVAEAVEQARHAHQLDVVGDGDAKALAAFARLEGLAGAQALLQLTQRAADRRLQCQCPRRWLHAPADAHQQRVVEQHAQATQRIAYRRLAQRQVFGGARDVLLAQQGVQYAQQVEVEVAEIHLLNTSYHKTKFQK